MKLTLLYPSSFSNCQVIDKDMQEEYDAALSTDRFRVVLFNYDQWLSGAPFCITGMEGAPGKAIYRGWMLKPSDYAKLYEEMKARDILLQTTPSEYVAMHLFPNVYPLISEDTAKTLFFEDGCVEMKAVKKCFRRFMVKDGVKSVKGTEFPAFFDGTVTQEAFDEWMKVFYQYRGGRLTGGICIKEYLDLKRYGNRTNEFRVFYANHQVISICRNSLQPDYTTDPPLALIEKYCHLPSSYYTVDYAELADGTWKIIEVGDGGVSGLSPEQNLPAYFRALFQALSSDDSLSDMNG